MLTKRIVTILSSILVLGGIAGGVVAVEDRYTKNEVFLQLAQRVDRKILRDDIRSYQLQIWDMERNYGKEKAQKKREYKEIKYKQKLLEEELRKK